MRNNNSILSRLLEARKLAMIGQTERAILILDSVMIKLGIDEWEIADLEEQFMDFDEEPGIKTGDEFHLDWDGPCMVRVIAIEGEQARIKRTMNADREEVSDDAELLIDLDELASNGLRI